MAKKKSLLVRFAGVAFGALKWLAVHLFALLKWLVLATWSALNWLLRTGKQTATAAKTAHAESKRPSAKPQYSSLQPLDAKEGSLAAFEFILYGPKSTIGIALGARGSGKSALGMRILENVSAQSRRAVYAVGFDRMTLPQWMHSLNADQLNDAPNGSFLLVDEGGISFSSRSSMSSANKLLSDLLFISRHKDLSVLFITQNSSNLEINAIRQTDYLLLKPPSLLQKDLERKVIQDLYEKHAPAFKTLKPEHPGLVYIHADAFQGFAENTLPTFWNERVSKAFKNKSGKR